MGGLGILGGPADQETVFYGTIIWLLMWRPGWELESKETSVLKDNSWTGKLRLS